MYHLITLITFNNLTSFKLSYITIDLERNVSLALCISPTRPTIEAIFIMIEVYNIQVILISGPSLLHKWSEFTSQVVRVYFKSGASSN